MVESTDTIPEDDGPERLPRDPKRALTILGVTLAFVAALALIPKLLGFGWFGGRMIFSREIAVYVLNTSGQDLEIELPFGAPMVVHGGTIETMHTLTGPITVTARDMNGGVVEEIALNARGDLFYNAAGSECLAVADLTGFYGGEDDFQVIARIPQDQAIYEITSDTFILPRRVAPDQARGTVHWIETVGCNLLEEAESDALVFQLGIRLQTRREQHEEELRQLREAQGR